MTLNLPKQPINLAQLKSDLIRDEGLRLKVYTDSTGNKTWGVGRNLSGNPLSPEEVETLLDLGNFTEEAAIYLLEQDIDRCMSQLDKHLPWWRECKEHHQRAIVNLCFNLGIKKLLKFEPTLTLMKIGDFKAAAARLKNTLWYTQVGNRGKRIVEAFSI